MKEQDTPISASLPVCVVGAGCSGLTTAKRLLESGIAYEQFEVSDDVGGNWYHNNPNGMSACYQSLHIDTSKWRLAFEDFPVPTSWPDFPHHSQLLQYFRDYTDHFKLRPHISFNTAVEDAVQEKDGTWNVRLSNGEEKRYSALIVANGHHWQPNMPEYPGSFDGVQLHSHEYDSPFKPMDFRGKKVLVVGAGNSAMDIAAELSQKPIAENLLLSTRRGVWVFPKYMNGVPLDKLTAPSWIPPRVRTALARRTIKKLVGRMEDYGLPAPDHEPLEAHPSVSGELLMRLGCGDVQARGAIERLDGDKVVFASGQSDKVDVIIWATGYRISFPFLKQQELQAHNNSFPLYKRMIKPGWANLFFMGLAQSLPTLVNLAEQQSKYVVAVLQGRKKLPSEQEMLGVMEKEEKKALAGYYASARHTIQVDFGEYVKDLQKELRSSPAA